jgi:hypothetical protein
LTTEGLAALREPDESQVFHPPKEKSMKTTRYIVTVLALLLSSAAMCAAFTKSDYDRKFDFSKLRTWDFKAQHRKAKDILGDNELWTRRLRTDIESDLSGKGYQKISQGEPDFLVAYYMGTKEKEDVRYLGYGFPGYWRGRRWGWGWGGDVDVWRIPYNQSTLVVDIVDARNNMLVWRGYDTETIDLNKSDKTIEKSVDTVIARFAKEAHKEKK